MKGDELMSVWLTVVYIRTHIELLSEPLSTIQNRVLLIMLSHLYPRESYVSKRRDMIGLGEGFIQGQGRKFESQGLLVDEMGPAQPSRHLPATM